MREIHTNSDPKPEQLQLPSGYQPYKLTENGIIGYHANRLELSSSTSEAEDALKAAEQIGQVHQGNQPPITYKPNYHAGGYEILTNPNTANEIAKLLNRIGYLEEDDYNSQLETLGLNDFTTSISINMLKRARSLGADKARNLVQNELRKNKKSKKGLIQKFKEYVDWVDED